MKRKISRLWNNLEWNFSIIVILIVMSLLTFIGYCFEMEMVSNVPENNQQVITGNIEAIDTVSFEELSDDYLLIIRYQEKYTKHFETKKVGNKVDTVETFTWDRVSKEVRMSEEIKFLGNVTDLENLNISSKIKPLELNENDVTSKYKTRAFLGCLYKDNTLLDTLGDIRYRYEYIPKKIEIKVLMNMDNCVIINPEDNMEVIK